MTRRTRGMTGLFAMVVALGCGTGGVPAPGPDHMASEIAVTEHFAFHSDPWINLHHFLYWWSATDLATSPLRVSVPERDDPPEGDDGAAWEAALAFYRDNLAERSYWDDEMLAFKAALLEPGVSADALPEVLPGHADALREAMAVYQSRWWPEHGERNRTWTHGLLERVQAYEGAWTDVASRAFGAPWHDGVLRVDVSAYANFAGGYTSNEPTHVTIYAGDPNMHRGLYGLEILFHETLHQRGLSGAAGAAIRSAFGEQGVGPPDNLRHMMIFATAGRFIETAVAADEGVAHEFYAVDQGIVESPRWRDAWRVVREHWLPAVDGTATLSEAVERMAAATAAGSS